MRRLILLLLILPAISHADEWWAWTLIDFWKAPPWSSGVFLGNRLDTEDGSHVQIVSPRLRYQLLPWLQTSVNLSALSIENTNTHVRYWQARPEFELNPRLDVTRHLQIENRNRLEWRMNEGEAFTTHRLRDRLQLAWTLPESLGPLTRIFVSNEWMIDLHRRNWTENRLVPLGLTFKLTSNTDLDLFYMVDSIRPKGRGWDHESVVGTYLRVRF